MASAWPNNYGKLEEALGHTPWEDVAYEQGPHSSLIFLVEIEKLYEYVQEVMPYGSAETQRGHIGFSEISGISMGVETRTYWEGSSPFPKHVPVRNTVQTAKFRKGVAPFPQYEALVRWFELVNRATLGDLEKLPSSTITILVPGDPRFSLVPGKTIDNVHDFVEGVGANKDPIWYSKLVLGDAWPTSITFGDFNASRSEVLISDMDIVYHSMNYITESS